MLSHWKKTLPDILTRYNASDIYNVDESDLFYQCLPNKTFTLSAEKASRGIKESKQRLTMLIGANMSGENKLDPLIIGKSANPRCFCGVHHIPLPYRSNTKAVRLEVFYLPPNTTSHTQPCDQWIIQTLKLKYRS